MAEQTEPAHEQVEEVTGELVQMQGAPVTERLRGRFDAEQVNLIRATVAQDCNNAELAIFLETCARHDLDPFIKEIWAIKIKGKVQIFASRDGLLGIANRHTPEGKYHVRDNGQFLGCPAGVIREHDHFNFRQEERADETMKVIVDHQPRDKAGKPTHGGEDGGLRGKIVGAWARCRRKGHDDVFFIAYWKTYNQARNAWTTHPDAMIQKCAESVALRKAFSIAGVVGEGEMPGGERPAATHVANESTSEIHWPEDADLKQRLEDVFGILGWRRAKVRMTVNAVGMEGGAPTHEALLERLTSEANRQLDRDAAEEDEPIQEAEVVDEPQGAGAA
jgi:hypothetical protein